MHKLKISMQTDGVNFRYLKFRLVGLTKFKVWNIKVLRHWAGKILGLENGGWAHSVLKAEPFWP